MAKIMSPKEPQAIVIQGFETEKGNGYMGILVAHSSEVSRIE